MSTLFEKGSRWRKWDLHVHTPSSYDYKNKSITDEEFIEMLVDNKISVVAITDHHIIDTTRIKKLQGLGKEKEITILPGIEFCSELGGSKPVHFIGIFDEHCDINEIWNKLQVKCRISDKDRETKGEDKIICDLQDTCNIIHELGGITSIHGGTKGNSFESIKGYVHKLELKTQLLSQCIDIIEIGDEDDINSIYDKVFKSIKLNLPIVICSDNHDIKNYNVKSNCWIKSDPTFEGLKQIIFEPDRVKIQQTNPIDSKIKLAVIDKIVLTDENVYNTEIQLNPYLNCIIGGRSTGKSMLLGAIAHKMGKMQETPHNQLQQLTDNLTLEWLDGVEDNNRDIEYISQGEMHKLHTDMEQDGDPKLKQIVHKILLNTSDKQNLYNEFEEFSKKSGKSIINMHVDLLSFYDELNSIKQKITELGDESSITQSIKELTDTISSMDIITDQEQKILDEFNKKLREIEEQTGDILHKKESLSTIKTHITNIFESEINFEGFTDLQKIFDEGKSQLLNKIDEQISQERKVLNEKNDELGIRHTEITEDTKYLELTEKTRKSNEYEELRKKIQEQAHMLVSLNKALEKRKEVEKKFNEARESFVKEHKQYHKKLTELCNLLQLDSEDLKISTTPKLLASKIHQVFSDNIRDTRTREEQKLIKIDNVKSIDEFITYISNILKGIFDDKVFASYRSGKTYKDLLQSLSQFFYEIDYSIFYENDDEFRNMSEGKKSFVVLKLILEFSNKTCPLLIDQPEDDLDNRSIYTDLVKYIKSKKIDRQIILVTHNPNIVVGADAEEVIIANQHGTKTKNESDKKFQYITGSLEHTSTKDTQQDIILKSQGIREHVCDILEGGQSAFEKREHKYNFHN